jgi:hypothetical protein
MSLRRSASRSSRVPEIEAAAQEEHRAPSGLVGEAVERYLSERRWFPKDEVHAKIAQGSHPCGKARASTARPSWPNCLRNSTRRNAHPKCRASFYLLRAGKISGKSGAISQARAATASPDKSCRRSQRVSVCWPFARRLGMFART